MTGRNIEIKAYSRNSETARADAERLSGAGPVVIIQEDTFFNCRSGRLKLRKFSDNDGELIFYKRIDSAEPSESSYVISETASPGKLKAVLAEALGIAGIVKKVRTLYVCDQTRIHLDEVEGLGRFIELEVVLAEGQSEAEGRQIANTLMKEMGISKSDLIDCAYIDMLNGKAG